VPDLQVLGIADHYACRVACEAAAIAGPTDLLVLPGMEVDVRPGEFSPDTVHFVALFPDDSASEGVYFVQDLGGPPYGQRLETGPLTCTCDQLLQLLGKRGALCIAAHVHATSGARGWARKSSLELVPLARRKRRLEQLAGRSPEEDTELQTISASLHQLEDTIQSAFLRFLGTHDIAAIEVQSAEDVPYYRGEHCEALGISPMACLVSSDAHSPGEVAPRGRRTYLRMSGLSLSGVRGALSDPETRIRYDLPDKGRAVVRGIRFAPSPDTGGGFFLRRTRL
jgi:hypothetical protein